MDVGRRALRQQHREDLARRSVTEKLAKSFLVIADAMAFDQGDEIVLRVAAERGFAEMRVGGKKALRRYFKIGEIAAAAARHENLAPPLISVFAHQHAPPPIPGPTRPPHP